MTTYFEVSTIIDYHIRNKGAITGIQRVEINIIREYLKHDNSVRILYCQSPFTGFLSFDCAQLVATGHLDEPEKIIKLPLYSDFPSKLALKILLENKRGWVRLKNKFNILRLAIFNKEKYIESIKEKLDSRIISKRTKTLESNDVVFTIGNLSSIKQAIHCLSKFKKNNGRVIQTIHDIIPVTHPQFFDKKSRTKFSRWLNDIHVYATHLHCVSDNTKKEIINHLDLDHFADIFSVPLAHEFIGYPRIKHDFGINRNDDSKEPYVLCVGTLEIRKNGLNLLRAWKAVYEKIGDSIPTLIFAGKRGWILDNFDNEYHSDQFYKKHVRFELSPSDQRLAELYQKCMFTIYPSFYEGWGLPVGESLWFGKNCVTSHTSSLPQVGGDLVDYIDPNNVTAMSEVIIKNIIDTKHTENRNNLIANSSLRYWSDVSLELYEYQKKI